MTPLSIGRLLSGNELEEVSERYRPSAAVG